MPISAQKPVFDYFVGWTAVVLPSLLEFFAKMKTIMNTQLKHDRTFADFKPGSAYRPEGGTHGRAGMKSEDIAAVFDQEQQAPTAEPCASNVPSPRAQNGSTNQSLNPQLSTLN